MGQQLINDALSDIEDTFGKKTLQTTYTIGCAMPKLYPKDVLFLSTVCFRILSKT